MAVASIHLLPAASADRHLAGSRPVRVWLWSLALLVGLMVAVGGATRLTGSGLSITEWRPVTGALPPLSEAAWADEFAKYRGSSQYENLNAGMTLPAFKGIYWWEWGHRLLGRLIGLAFLAPLLWFWGRGALGRRQALALLGIGALGGLQGAVGWIMVASGLEPGMIAVAPVKLALHLVLASVILALIVWMAAGLAPGAGRGGRTIPAWPALALLALVLLQIGLGGLVAGSRAGLTYNTWPLMDGRLVPEAGTLFVVRPWFENLVDNPALVQLQHRLTAYLAVALVLWQAWSVGRAAPGSPAAARTAILAGLALAQTTLGIVTLLLVVPLWAALAHQLLAMLLLAAAAAHARLTLAERAMRHAPSRR